MIQINTALMLKADFHLKLKGTRASVLHAWDDSAVIQFLHPHNWNKNTFATIPIKDIEAYFQLAPPLSDFYLNEYLVTDAKEDRKGGFTFDLNFHGQKVGGCQSNGYSDASFTCDLNGRYHPAVQRLLKSIYTKCLPLIQITDTEEALCLLRLEIALYLRSNLNNGAISFYEYIKTKQGFYLDLEENPSEYSWRNILNNVTEANHIKVKQY